MQMRPTCRFVQVINGCGTAEAGAGDVAFQHLRLFFSYGQAEFIYYEIKTLATSKIIGYNVQEYALIACITIYRMRGIDHMSASKKKQLRKELFAGQMTEKQLQQQKEAKKTKLYTIGFIVVMSLVLCIALGVLGVRAVNQSGIIQRRTMAAQIGTHKLNTIEFSYFFQDAIQDEYNAWYEVYGSSTDYYLSLMGLDLNKPLDKQEYFGGETWADYFLTAAANNAQKAYAIYDAAIAAGHTLSDEAKNNIDVALYNLKFWATYGGYKNVDKYLSSIYSYGATEENYRQYLTVLEMSESYYDTYVDSLKYDDAAIREFEKDKYVNYTSYSYVRAYFNYNYFLTGGTEGEDGVVTYTEDEKNAARAAAKAAAETLLSCKTADEFEMAVKQLGINKDLEEKDFKVKGTEYKNQLYTSVENIFREWISSKDRVAGETTMIENLVSTGEAEEGEEEVKELYGYYVCLFLGSNNNEVKMSNVRHLLVQFEGGTKNDKNETVYSDEEKKAAKDKAEELLKKWQEGEKVDEDSFAELVKENTDDTGSAANGGLFENIYYGSSYVENFLNWAIDADRKKGDVEIVETEYGYHIMYYSGDAELNYRDFLITNDMRSQDTEKWVKGLLEATPVTMLDTSKVRLG